MPGQLEIGALVSYLHGRERQKVIHSILKEIDKSSLRDCLPFFFELAEPNSLMAEVNPSEEYRIL